MKKVLLAAALIGGTFFSANAEGTLSEDFFGCVDVVEETSTTEYLPDGTEITVTTTITRRLCSVKKITIAIQTIEK